MNVRTKRTPKIRGNRTGKVQAINKELELVFAGNSKMTDDKYKRLEGLTF